MVPRPFVRYVVALLAALALAGCGSGGESGGSETAPPQSASTPPSFPVTLQADGTEVVLERRPSRIVSLSPTATESLFAIGAGKQLAAVDDQSNYPADAPRTELSGYTPNAEAIAAYEPDLVVAAFDPGGLVAALETLDIPLLLQPAPAGLDEAYAQIEQLGLATGRRGAAARLVERLKSRTRALVDSAKMAASRLTVYHELGPDYYSVTSKTFIGSIYKLLGLRNIADEAGAKAPDYPQLSAEYIVEADPDLIVLADTKCCGQTPSTLASRPGWAKIAAVENDAVVPVSDDVASRWGPRIVGFVEAVASTLKSIASKTGSQ